MSAARVLDEQVPPGTLRVVTDGRRVVDIAAEVVAATGWVEPPAGAYPVTADSGDHRAP